MILLETKANTDGMSGIFWLFLNWGRFTSSKRKIFLTAVNLLVFAIGACLVSVVSPVFLLQLHTNCICSAASASGFLEKQYTTTLVGPVSHVLTTARADRVLSIAWLYIHCFTPLPVPTMCK